MIRILLVTCSILLTVSCAHSKQGKYRVEKNQPRFSNTRTFESSVADVERAALAVLKDKIADSEAATAADPKIESEPHKISTGWIYETAKDKYVEYKVNGVPKRKILKVRRKYALTILPSIAGADVTVTAEEEIEDIDLKTGTAKGWKSATVDTAAYQMLLSDLSDKIRSL